jgi:RNA polymerase sigma factor (sigma-70 family)
MTDTSSASSSLLTRPSLLFRLRDWEDGTSWAEFYRLYRRFVYGLATRSGLNHTEAEDVVQDVFRHVAEKIGEFEARPNKGAFRRWLMNQTRWRISDKFRERQRGSNEVLAANPLEATAPGQTLPNQDGPQEDDPWENEWQHHVLDAAMERLARRVPAKHFQAFELYSRQGWPVRQVARELGLSSAAVYLYNHRLTKQLRTEVQHIRHSLG